MRISEAWLREWVDPPIDTQELASTLTMAGLEVGAVEDAAPPFSGVVVGHVVSCERHPEADKLSVCEVDTGSDDNAHIVCGAPNVRAGLKVAVATVGARLPGGMKIRKAKLRGVVSFGMICSSRELGLGDDHDGIMELADSAPVGEALRDYMQLDDRVLELELTANRGDCLSMAGVAREVGVLTRLPVTPPSLVPVESGSDATFGVTLSAPEACPRFAGRVVRGIDPAATTPPWMVERLRRAGIRSLGPVVDITNYVMLETGQPMHGYDLATLDGAIDVRLAKDGEKVTLLDGREVALQDDVLVITDASRVLGLAGIMGGEDTGVSDQTQDVYFESAFFAPEAIAGRARRYGLHTDASHRFERGVYPGGQEAAVERATRLLIDIAGGAAGPLRVVESAEHVPVREPVPLRAARLEAILGVQVERSAVDDIFERLGCAVESDGGGWLVTPPGWRFDIGIPEDLIEEVARIRGYDQVPERRETAALSIAPVTETRVALDRVQDALVDRGYQEVITYSFVDPAVHDVVCPGIVPLPLKNPISSDLAVMRASLWPGLVGVLKHNLARQQARLRIFENGLRFIPQDNNLRQENAVAMALTGRRWPEHWDHDAAAADFHDLAGDALALLGLGGAGRDLALVPDEHPALHPGQSARITLEGDSVGWLGALHPQRCRQLDIDVPVYLAELDFRAAFAASVPRYREISRFPALRRDISVVVDDDVTVADMTAAIRAAASTILRDVRVFDVYRGKGIDSGRKSVSFGLILQDSSRTLSDGDADAAVESVVTRLSQEFNGKIRD